MMRQVIVLLALFASTVYLSPFIGQATAGEATGKTDPKTGERFSPYVDSSGNISRPQGFRKEWTHLGSWFVQTDEQASGPGVHDVYAEPDAVKAFLENGRWPDGATLVKEIRSIRRGQLPTGNAQWGGEVGVWFVMVRDRKNRFPNNDIWGGGWGWALYKAGDPAKNVNQNWKQGDLSNCHGCHAPARDTEWVFIDGYPKIREAAKYPTKPDN